MNEWQWDGHFDWTSGRNATYVRVSGTMNVRYVWFMADVFPSFIKYSGWRRRA